VLTRKIERLKLDLSSLWKFKHVKSRNLNSVIWFSSSYVPSWDHPLLQLQTPYWTLRTRVMHVSLIPFLYPQLFFTKNIILFFPGLKRYHSRCSQSSFCCFQLVSSCIGQGTTVNVKIHVLDYILFQIISLLHLQLVKLLKNGRAY